jgi:hypothetical protein
MRPAARMALYLCVIGAAGAASAQSDPAAPPGWSARDGGAARLYRPDSTDDVELRLYPGESARGDLESYMEARMARGVTGLGGIDFAPLRELMTNSRMALGMTGGGRPRVVVVIGCDTQDGRKRYGELLLPPDPEQVEPLVEQAAGILAQSCLDPALLAGDAPAVDPAAKAPPAQPFTGDPLDPDLIEGVLYSWRQVYEVTGLRFIENTYLLMDDGTARDGVPDAAPAEFDLEADRAANPALWGRWRKRWGREVDVAFEDGWETPPGQLRPVPGRPGERLEGRFEKSSSYAIGDIASWANWGLTLARDGTFERWRTGGAGGSSGWGDGAVVGMGPVPCPVPPPTGRRS